MKKILVFAALLLIASASAMAQDEFPKFELSGMANMTRLDIQELDNETTWGYAVGGQYNANKWFGIVGEWVLHMDHPISPTGKAEPLRLTLGLKPFCLVPGFPIGQRP